MLLDEQVFGDNKIDTIGKFVCKYAASIFVIILSAHEEYLDNVRRFVIKMGSEFGAVFDALWTHGDETRLERIEELYIESIDRNKVKKKVKSNE